MKVLFLRDLSGVGDYGQVKEVANGYARHFLIPQGIAVPATAEALKQFEEKKKKAVRESAHELKLLQQLATALDGYEFDIAAKVNEHGQLYAAVGGQKIAQELRKHGFDIKKTHVRVVQSIKEPGSYTATIDLGHGLEAEVRFNVTEGQ